MQRLTSLPIVLSTLVLWTSAGSAGCGGSSGGNTGGGGASTGGTGGGPDVGGTGGAPVDLPACEVPAWKVMGCAQPVTFSEQIDAPVDIDTTGTVTAVRSPAPDEPCGPTTSYRLGYREPEVMLDLTLADGSPLTLGLAAPGLSQGLFTEGETLAVIYHYSYSEGDTFAALEVRRAGEIVAAVGENSAVGLAPGPGAGLCYEELGECGREHLTMEVAAPDGSTVSIDPGESADVGGLLVTNDDYFRYYDISGICNFGQPLKLVMSAVAAE